MADIKPCPFCGHAGLEFSEGSTFRWIVASCGGCGATTGETRIQTLGQGTKDEWMAHAQTDATEQWNRRPEPDCRTCARCYSTKGRGVYGCDSVVGCTNGARYQPLPPVRLYRTNVGVEPVTPATEER